VELVIGSGRDGGGKRTGEEGEDTLGAVSGKHAPEAGEQTRRCARGAVAWYVGGMCTNKGQREREEQVMGDRKWDRRVVAAEKQPR